MKPNQMTPAEVLAVMENATNDILRPNGGHDCYHVVQMEAAIESVRAAFSELEARRGGVVSGEALRDAYDRLMDRRWRPISEVPKDGTCILLYAPAQEFRGKPTEPRLTFGHWLVAEGGTREHRDLDGNYVGQDDDDGYEGWMSWDGGFTEENPATHFQFLPTPPQEPDNG